MDERTISIGGQQIAFLQSGGDGRAVVFVHGNSLLPCAAGYWNAADNLIGLLKTMPPADQACTDLSWIHQIITSRGKEPGMGAWLAVEWLRSLSERQAVNDETRPLYNAVLDALAAESYRGAVELQRRGE